jgi:hypothetical protein
MANVGKVDSFTYTVTDPVTGRTDTATLHVQVIVRVPYTPITVAGVPATTVVVLPFSAVTAVTTDFR